MVAIETFRNLALSFPGAEEAPHFDRATFKVVNKRIFVTMHEVSKTANLKFSPENQALYCSYDKKDFIPAQKKK